MAGYGMGPMLPEEEAGRLELEELKKENERMEKEREMLWKTVDRMTGERVKWTKKFHDLDWASRAYRFEEEREHEIKEGSGAVPTE